ncbi:hypothetical protein BYT27DRAFT_7200277, partial [Phlegmacium glaucopus]
MSKPLTLKIDIAHEDLVTLRAGGFNLCLSRTVQFNGMRKPGNIVFYACPSRYLRLYLAAHIRSCGRISTKSTEQRSLRSRFEGIISQPQGRLKRERMRGSDM